MKKLLLIAIVLAGCTSKEQHQADDTKRAVMAKMKDPESSKFSNMKVFLGTLCGEINSKNSFGAYTGADPFTAGGGAVTLRSGVTELDNRLIGTKAGEKVNFTKSFDESYQRCQEGGKSVT